MYKSKNERIVMKKVLNILFILIVLSLLICHLQNYVSGAVLDNISSNGIINYHVK